MKTALSKVEDVSWEQEELEKISTNIFIQEEIINKNNELRASLYEDLKDGIISKEDYEDEEAEDAIHTTINDDEYE